MRRSICVALLVAGAILPSAAQERKTRNVIFVMTDGLRWQDVFRGADPKLSKTKTTREALLPFLWTTVAKEGQIYGNRDLESDAYVTNGLDFSYPGYSEIFCGFPDPRVDSNDKKPNPNANVLEWLHGKAEFRGKVAAFGAWDVFPFILNAKRSGLPVYAGYDTYPGVPELLNRLNRETNPWPDESFDSFPFRAAVEYLKAQKPRVLYVSLGETDEWAHDGKYALYLQSAQRVDAYVQELWETAQSLPEYRGTTTLVLVVDHGRGEASEEWRSHGEKLPDSKYVWMGFLGPDTRALGERSRIAPVTQSQVAATIAGLLGEDYAASEPKAGKPIVDVLPARTR